MLDLLLAFFLPIPETGGGIAYAPYRWGPKDAPIHMQGCEASTQIYRGVVYKSTLWYGGAFAISGPKTANEVRLRFTFTDDRWQPVAVEEQTIVGTFAPGAKISRMTKSGGQFKHANTQPKAAAVLCSPIAVRFVDGTSWTWNPPPTPYPLPGALPATPPPAAFSTPTSRQSNAPTVRATAGVQPPLPAGAEFDYE